MIFRLFDEVQEDADRERIRRNNAKRVAFIIVALLGVLTLSSWSLTLTSSNMETTTILKALVNFITPGTFDVPVKSQLIVERVYLPRVLMALFAGGILAIGGCLTQTILKNPLATPYTLGVSASASFGAGLAIILGISAAIGNIGIILNAFLFSMIPATVILIVSARKNMMATTLILIGVSLSYLFTSANTLLQYFGDAEAVKAALFWTVGDLNSTMLNQIPYVAITFVATSILAIFLIKDIDIMRMGDDTAKSLGIDVRLIRTASIILACFSTAVVISFVGAIGFVCLLAPQISRMVVGGNLKFLLPSSAVLGAFLLTVADIIAKYSFHPMMLPVGAITALIGAPVLIFLLIRNRNMVVS